MLQVYLNCNLCVKNEVDKKPHAMNSNQSECN